MSAMDVNQGAPRPALGLVRDSFTLYRCYPLLFLTLAAGVIVPYELIVLALTGTGPLARSSLDFQVESLLTIADFALIGPLVSALHIQAVAEVREGGKPLLGSIARQGLGVLPAVTAVSIVSWLGIAVGFFALVVPGIILTLRWSVVAQAAAIEREGWLPALRRSGELARDHYGHILALVLCIGLIVLAPTLLVGIGFGHDATDAASFLVGVIVQVFAYSFGALVTALLYYDLRARQVHAAAPPLTPDAPPTSHVQDPRNHDSEDRPKGWYVDPRNPRRMRYWGAGNPPGWSGAVRTPRKVRHAWEQADGGESRLDG